MSRSARDILVLAALAFRYQPHKITAFGGDDTVSSASFAAGRADARSTLLARAADFLPAVHKLHNLRPSLRCASIRQIFEASPARYYFRRLHPAAGIPRIIVVAWLDCTRQFSRMLAPMAILKNAGAKVQLVATASAMERDLENLSTARPRALLVHSLNSTSQTPFARLRHIAARHL
jgi:hypothetical protein